MLLKGRTQIQQVHLSKEIVWQNNAASLHYGLFDFNAVLDEDKFCQSVQKSVLRICRVVE